MTTMYVGGRRSPSTRQWIALGATGAAVVLLVVLVAVACQGRTGATTALPDGGASASPSPATTQAAGLDDADGADASGAIGTTQDTSSSGSGTGSGSGNNGGNDGGSGNDGGPAALAGLEVISKDSNVQAGSWVGWSIVQCPKGKVVVGGGVWMDLTSPEDFRTQVRESGPLKSNFEPNENEASIWRVTFTNGAEETRTVRIFAVCAEPPPGYQLVTKDVVLSSGGGYERSWVHCPQGTVALAGGTNVMSGGGQGVRLQESLLVTPGEGWGWLAAASNTDSVDRTMRISVVCSEPPAGHEYVSKDYVMNGSGFLSTPHWCPEGTHILGGGAGVVGAAAGNYRTFLRESGPIHAGGDYRGWWLALSKASLQQHTVRVSATCVAAG